ncbi:MAG: R3H domain-containing nucleic acid-binding protein [bacterium]
MQKLIKDIKKLISKMGFGCEIETEGLFINIKTSESGLLIGQNGESICALQHLTKLIMIKSQKVVPQFTLDVNNYRQQKTESLKQIAKDSAYRACVLKKEIVLRPMPSYERRLVHMELADRKDVITESRGEEPNRRVIVRAK